MGNSIVMKVPNTGGLAHFLTMEVRDGKRRSPRVSSGDGQWFQVGQTGNMSVRGEHGMFTLLEAYAECFPPGVVNFISGRGRDTMPPCPQLASLTS